MEKLSDKVELVTMDEVKATKAHALHRPCDQCPFTRTIGTTVEERGNPDPLVYIGQAFGPFNIPCHCADKDYRETEQWKKVDHTLQQCAGAAIFRANCGLNGMLPSGLQQLEPDKEVVFATPAELVAHHLQIPLEVAEFGFKMVPIEMLVQRQLDVWRAKMAARDPKVVLTLYPNEEKAGGEAKTSG